MLSWLRYKSKATENQERLAYRLPIERRRKKLTRLDKFRSQSTIA